MTAVVGAGVLSPRRGRSRRPPLLATALLATVLAGAGGQPASEGGRHGSSSRDAPAPVNESLAQVSRTNRRISLNASRAGSKEADDPPADQEPEVNQPNAAEEKANDANAPDTLELTPEQANKLEPDGSKPLLPDPVPELTDPVAQAMQEPDNPNPEPRLPQPKGDLSTDPQKEAQVQEQQVEKAEHQAEEMVKEMQDPDLARIEWSKEMLPMVSMRLEVQGVDTAKILKNPTLTKAANQFVQTHMKALLAEYPDTVVSDDTLFRVEAAPKAETAADREGRTVPPHFIVAIPMQKEGDETAKAASLYMKEKFMSAASQESFTQGFAKIAGMQEALTGQSIKVTNVGTLFVDDATADALSPNTVGDLVAPPPPKNDSKPTIMPGDPNPVEKPLDAMNKAELIKLVKDYRAKASGDSAADASKATDLPASEETTTLTTTVAMTTLAPTSKLGQAFTKVNGLITNMTKLRRAAQVKQKQIIGLFDKLSQADRDAVFRNLLVAQKQMESDARTIINDDVKYQQAEASAQTESEKDSLEPTVASPQREKVIREAEAENAELTNDKTETDTMATMLNKQMAEVKKMGINQEDIIRRVKEASAMTNQDIADFEQKIADALAGKMVHLDITTIAPGAGLDDGLGAQGTPAAANDVLNGEQNKAALADGIKSDENDIEKLKVELKELQNQEKTNVDPDQAIKLKDDIENAKKQIEISLRDEEDLQMKMDGFTTQEAAKQMNEERSRENREVTTADMKLQALQARKVQLTAQLASASEHQKPELSHRLLWVNHQIELYETQVKKDVTSLNKRPNVNPDKSADVFKADASDTPQVAMAKQALRALQDTEKRFEKIASDYKAAHPKMNAAEKQTYNDELKTVNVLLKEVRQAMANLQKLQTKH
eukprot:TRINITY_DN11787_c0_g1_i1.p1 TRINITY_DN11787_c0_g1~~TRINITY_DN11787_c0_g1_i1.p1  ORF type:complete len:891 (-),score=250.63 TRINITY_DN11787_c0_g1_i1:312-2984(-)